MNHLQAAPEHEPIDDLADDFLARYRRGERPPLTEYATANPQLAEEIRELFPTLVMLERLSPRMEDLSADLAAAGPAAGVPQQLGEYRILREVGRGGMGIVYEAEQLSLGRHVALKVLPAHAVLTPHLLTRFQNEARVAARLHHTNIVPVFGVGEDQGIHFYAMQFIQGHSLDAVLEELRRLQESGAPLLDVPASSGSSLDGAATGCTSIRQRGDTSASYSTAHGVFFRSVARMGLQVADALAYAHSQGVLHRDVKPSNLLLDAHGCVWVTDFGLAKQEGSELTKTGDVVGTLRYLAPERFRGTSDVRSDIYGLGVTLYELLAIRPAFDETDRVRLVHDIVHVDPVSPRRLQGRVPRDLETIVLKAMAKEPPARYQTAEDIAADLRRFLDDQPIAARRARAAERVWRWCVRRPALAGLSAALLLSLFIGLAGVLWQWRRAETSLKEAVRQQGAAESSLSVAKLATQRAERNLQEADRQRGIARQEAQRAEANHRTARQAVDELFTMVSEDELRSYPQLQPLRVRLMMRAHEYYQGMLERQGDDPKARAELAENYLRIAAIQRTIGAVSESSDAYEKGIALLEAILAEGYEPSAALQLAGSCSYLALQHIRERKFEEAGRLLLRARDVLEVAAEKTPSTEADRLTAMTLNNIAWWTSQRPSDDRVQAAEDAIDMHEQALVIYRRLAKENPSDYVIHRAVSSTLSNMARRNMYVGRNEEAQRLFEECLQIRQGLAEDNPASHDAKWYVAAAFDGLGDVLSRMSPATPEVRQRAGEHYQKAVDILEPLVHDNPVITDYPKTLVDVLTGIAGLHAKANDLHSASLAQQRVTALLKARLSQDPGNWRHHSDLAASTAAQADLARKLQRHADSITLRFAARDAWKEARRLEPWMLTGYRNAIIVNLSNLMQELGAAERLGEVYEIALERRELCDGDPRRVLILAAGLERSVRAALRGAELSPDQAELAEECLDLAIELFLTGAEAAPTEAEDVVDGRPFMRDYAALAAAEAALQKEPNSAAALAERSRVLRQLGHTSRANRDLNQALALVNASLERSPMDGPVLEERARFNFEAQRYEQALADSAQVLAAAANDTQALTYHAQSAIHLHAWREAKDGYARLWKKNIRRPVYVLRWCRAAEELGLDAQVEVLSKRLWELVSRNAASAEASAWQMLADDDVTRFPDLALRLAQQAVELKPKTISCQATLGGVYYRLHRYDDALAVLEAAAQEPPGRASAFGGFWLAIILHHRGEPAAAQAAYERALRSWKETTTIPPDREPFLESLHKEAKSLIAGSELAAARS
jgi:serine/threonine-protein kinase